MRKIVLSLKNVKSEIFIGQELLSKVGQFFTKSNFPNRVVIITDKVVAKLYLQVLKHSLRSKGFKVDVLVVPNGEKTKSLKSAEVIYKKLLELKVHRDSTIVALGGGVVGDLAGFVAATYMRGVNFVQCPTTLLSQVDASIGGKVAVNLEEAKNIIGAFYQPRFIFSDITVLITLPPTEVRNGLSEIIKYGIIKDPKLFQFLEYRLNGLKKPKLTDFDDFKKLLDIWEFIVYSSARIKAAIVESDEKEITGKRMILNFGHTIGHAIEALNNYKGITHGQAVSIGMVAASKISSTLKICKNDIPEKLEKLLEFAGLPTRITRLGSDDIIAKLILDKKVRENKINFVLPKTIGSVVIKNDVPIKVVREVLKEIGAK